MQESDLYSFLCQINESVLFWCTWQLHLCRSMRFDMRKFWYLNIGILVFVLLVACFWWSLYCSHGGESSSLQPEKLKPPWSYNLGTGAWNWIWILESLWSSWFQHSWPWHIEDNSLWCFRNTWYVFDASKTEYWDIEKINQAVQENEVGIESLPST